MNNKYDLSMYLDMDVHDLNMQFVSHTWNRISNSDIDFLSAISKKMSEASNLLDSKYSKYH